MKTTPKRDQWRQISGDMDPAKYGAIIACYQGERIALIEIQPVREYVGDREALDVGFPFWSREAYYYPDELDPTREDVQSALHSCGFDADAYDDHHRALGIAECLMRYGTGTEEGRAGFAKDVLRGAACPLVGLEASPRLALPCRRRSRV